MRELTLNSLAKTQLAFLESLSVVEAAYDKLMDFVAPPSSSSPG